MVLSPQEQPGLTPSQVRAALLCQATPGLLQFPTERSSDPLNSGAPPAQPDDSFVAPTPLPVVYPAAVDPNLLLYAPPAHSYAVYALGDQGCTATATTWCDALPPLWLSVLQSHQSGWQCCFMWLCACSASLCPPHATCTPHNRCECDCGFYGPSCSLSLNLKPLDLAVGSGLEFGSTVFSPNFFAGHPSGEAMFSLEVPENVTLTTLTLDTCSALTNFSTFVWVMPGCPSANWSPENAYDSLAAYLSCDDGSLSSHSRVTLRNVPAGMYTVVVEGEGAAAGVFSLAWAVEAAGVLKLSPSPSPSPSAWPFVDVFTPSPSPSLLPQPGDVTGVSVVPNNGACPCGSWGPACSSSAPVLHVRTVPLPRCYCCHCQEFPRVACLCVMLVE